MSGAQIKVWHKPSKMVENLLKVIHILKDLQQAEHLRMLNAYRLQSTKTVRELEADLGIPNTTVSEILMQDLGMKHVMAKFIAWLLLPEQKKHHAAVANDLTRTSTNEPDFLKKVVTEDESWVYGYKAQASQGKLPGSPRQKV